MWPSRIARPSASAILRLEFTANAISSKPMKLLSSRLLLGSLLSTSFILTVPAQVPSVDDFVRPVTATPQKGGPNPREIKAPDQVKVSQQQVTTSGGPTPVVKAASTQDAINAAVAQMGQLKQDVSHIETGSGLGVVARGYSSYTAYPNRNASLISKRQAYAKAYMMAKKNLTQHLYGLSNESKQKLFEAMTAVDTATNTLANTGAVLFESAEQKTEGLIRGFVIYEVDDDVVRSQVTVAIVTTPKTRGETLRASDGFLLAKDLAAGMEQVVAEIVSGVVPPSGGRVITVPSPAGEQLYFLGFGSEINRINPNPAVERQLRSQSAEVAKLRAAASLCSLIVGDTALWKGGFSSATVEENRQFEVTDKATFKATGILAKPLEETRSSFLGVMTTRSEYKFAQKGQLPPGLNVIQWESPGGDWTIAAYIYNPAMTKEAQKAAEATAQGLSIAERGRLLAGSGKGSGPATPTGPTGKSGDRKDFGNEKPLEKCPSGEVQKKRDL